MVQETCSEEGGRQGDERGGRIFGKEKGCQWGGGGGPLNVHVDQNLAISESISYYCALQWVVKKEIKLH